MKEPSLPQPSTEEWADAAQAGSAALESSSPALDAPTVHNATLPAHLLQQIIDAARTGLPNEACGLLVGRSFVSDGAIPERYVSLVNAAASPYRYLIDAQEQLRVWLELEDAGEVVWAIVHSHVASPARPSATDIGLAFYPDSLYLICSLEAEMPDIRAWSIREGIVEEVSLAVSP